MDNKEKQIWDMVHAWCNEQASDIPDVNRRVLMDRILAIVLEPETANALKESNINTHD